MASSVESMTMATSQKTDEKYHMHSILHKSPPSGAKPSVKTKETGCDLLKRQCLGEDARPSAGMCMIAFAVPLLIPGVTLTAVAFDDETGFSKYSALHIIGMVMLALAILLIIVGVSLNIRFKSRVGPEERLHTVSTHEKFDLKSAEKASEGLHKNLSIHSIESRNAQPVNFMVESGHNLAAGDQHVHFQTAKVGAGSSLDAASANSSAAQESQRYHDNDYSSSYDSSDSEDYSSGSYVISDEVEDGRQPHRYVSDEGEITDTDDPKSDSKITTTHLQNAEHSVKKSTETAVNDLSGRRIAHSVSDTHIRNVDKNYNNFFQDSSESDVFFVTSEPSRGQRKMSSNVIKDSKGSTESTDDNCSHGNTTITVETHASPQVTPGGMADKSSPGTRQRLQALSSDALASPSEAYPRHDGSPEENCSGSNSSVFDVDREPKTDDIISNHRKDKEGAVVYSDSEVDSHVTWAQTAPPHPLPKRVRLSESSGAITKDDTLGDHHTASLGVFSR